MDAKKTTTKLNQNQIGKKIQQICS